MPYYFAERSATLNWWNQFHEKFREIETYMSIMPWVGGGGGGALSSSFSSGLCILTAVSGLEKMEKNCKQKAGKCKPFFVRNKIELLLTWTNWKTR